MRKNNKAKVKKVGKVKPVEPVESDQINYKTLPTSLNIGGFALVQIKREGDIALYSKERIKKPWCSHYQAGFEVIVIKRHKEYKLGTTILPAAETYAPNCLWGMLGFTCQDLDEAMLKFNELVQKMKDKDPELVAASGEQTDEADED